MKRVAGRLSYANVMSTVAVFLALGGGITLAAIQGDGSFRFGAAKDLPFLEWETVLSVPGIGKVQVFCAKGTGVRFKNTSGGTLQASVLRETDGDFEAASLAENESLETLAQGVGASDNIDTLRFHAFKASAGGKPTADLTLSHQYNDGDCANRAAAAQAVASE
jgi:hypothetical protein